MFYGNMMAPIPLHSVAYVCVIDEFFSTSITVNLFSDTQFTKKYVGKTVIVTKFV